MGNEERLVVFPPFQLSGSQGQHSHDPEHGYGWVRGGERGEGRGRREEERREEGGEAFSREDGPQQMITGSIVLVRFGSLFSVFVLRWALTKELGGVCIVRTES